MKKLFFFAVLAVALAAFGVRAGVVHAQTAPTGNTASLQQQLDVAKATLINLEMQAGMVPQGDDELGTGATAPSPAVAAPAPQVSAGLSESQVIYFRNVLSQLTVALTQLEVTVQQNPNMDAAQVSAIASTIGGMQGTVSAISTDIAEGTTGASAGAPVAVNSPAPAASPAAT